MRSPVFGLGSIPISVTSDSWHLSSCNSSEAPSAEELRKKAVDPEVVGHVLIREDGDSGVTVGGESRCRSYWSGTRGGTVFTTGCTEWVRGLTGHDPAVERITRNVFERLGKRA